MLKRSISVLIVIMLLVSVVPAFAAETNKLLLSEDFSSYAENETTFSTVTATSGVDTRVIRDAGNKVLYSRAFGTRISLKAKVAASSAKQTVISAKVKHTGKFTRGKLFTAVFNDSKLDFLNLYEDGSLRLSDGKAIRGIPHGYYGTITICVDWASGTYDVYMDKKCQVADWPLPSGSYSSAPSSLEWQMNYDPEAESALYLDDIRVYDGSTLPWKRTFPQSEHNENVLDFTPTEEIDKSIKIIRNLEFDSDSLGVDVVYNGGSVAGSTTDDGTKSLRMYADDKTVSNSYFDIIDDALSACSNYVIDIRFNVAELTGTAYNIFFDSTNTTRDHWGRGYKLLSDGSLQSITTGTNVGTVAEGTWTRLSVAYDFNAFTADVYFDGAYVTTHELISDFYPNTIRVDHKNRVGSTNKMFVDWVRVYTGNTLLDDESFAKLTSDAESAVDQTTQISIMDPADKLADALKNRIIYMPSNRAMSINGEKTTVSEEEAWREINGNLMIPLSTFETISAQRVSYNKESGLITIGDHSKLQLGSATCTLRDKELTLNAVPYEEEGIIYLPLRPLCEHQMGKKVKWDSRGFVVIGDVEPEPSNIHLYVDHHSQWHPMDLIYRFMQFDNPTGADMIAAVKERFPDRLHPRVWFTADDIALIHDRIETEKDWQVAAQNVTDDAEQYLNRDFTDYYHAENALKKGASFDFQKAMESLALAYVITGDSVYAEKGIEIMNGFASWDILAYKYSHLTIGQWSLGMAIGYDIFYNYMMATEHGQANLKHIRETASKICFADNITGYKTGTGPLWARIQDNFAGVISGGLMPLLLAVCDEDDVTEELDYLMENVLKSMYLAAQLYCPDGGYYEGVAYEEYHLEYLLFGVNALKNCCGTDYALGDAKGFANTGDFLTYMQSTDTSFAFHDSDNVYYLNSIRELLAYLYNDLAAAELTALQKNLAGKAMDLESLLYYEKCGASRQTITEATDAPLDAYFYASDSGSFRNSHDVSDPTFVGFHAGHTDVTHDMLDLGEFIFESDNEVWAIDMGRDSYALPAYFEKDGYRIYRKRPEGENCLMINPQVDVDTYYGQEVGVYCTLTDDSELNKPRGAKAAYDLTEAYQRDVSKYIRGYYFGDDRNTLTVQDELTLKNTSEVYWFMHTPANIEIISNSRARLTQNGKSCIVDVECSVPGFTLSEMEAKPLPTSPNVSGQKSNDGYRKLAIHYPVVSGDVTISVKLSPENNKYTYTPLTVTPISQWTIPDGELPEIPKFTSVCGDGKLLENFLPGRMNYTVLLDFGAESVPKITATSDMGEVAVKQADSLDDTAMITLKRAGYADTVCEVSFKINVNRSIQVTEDLRNVKPTVGTQGELLIPAKAYGKTLPEPENPPANMFDGDFNTRATQNGTNIWFEFDLGEVMDIQGVALSFYNGTARTSKFEILYSEDGINFQRVFSGSSTGTTNDYEMLNLPGSVRYIRYVGRGNSTGTWNSITEFRICK